MINNIKKDLQKLANSKKAEGLHRFFKTGPGEYGEGDKFLGLTSDQIKTVAKKYWQSADFKVLQKLLDSNIHEHRMAALRILVSQFENAKKYRDSMVLAPLRSAKARDNAQTKIFNFYLKNTKNINNWDLVDLSAPNIVGGYLLEQDRKILYKLAQSKNLWERRISIVATYTFIRQGDLKDTLKISEILLKDKHNLIHKAVGWMLREAGKRDQKVLIKFLDKYARQMPRTCLRYSIEKLSDKQRKYYLKKHP